MVLLSPGLSVIIKAIQESRKIFQRMQSYAIYRIAETIRVLLFMTLSILVFNFYPITAVMIVLLALLHDGAILSIAYDHVRSPCGVRTFCEYSERSRSWTYFHRCSQHVTEKRPGPSRASIPDCQVFRLRRAVKGTPSNSAVGSTGSCFSAC